MLVETLPETYKKRQDNQALLDEIATLRQKVKELEDLARILASSVRPDPAPDIKDKKLEYSGMFQ